MRERYFATFRHAPDVWFLLPRRWPAKDGKVVFTPPDDPRITKTAAYFWHSHYPVIGGLLKGFMPAFPLYLWEHRRQIDLVYSCSEPTLLTTLYQAFWSKFFGKKHVCFSWENIPYDKKFQGLSRVVHAFILRMNLLFSDGLICGNSAGMSIHRAYTHKPIMVIPMNGVDSELFRPNPEFRLHGELAAKTVFTFVGAIGYRKGIHHILNALPHVLAKIPEAHVIIAGSGEYEQTIEQLIDTLDLREYITRFPWVDQHELIRLLSISDVFAYPSIPHGGWAEQFGYSMAEASLMELPVISTRSGSIADVVRDGETGLLVPPDDAHALANAMIRLGSDEHLRHQLGQAGRQYIMANFSHRIIAQRFSDFFRSIFT